MTGYSFALTCPGCGGELSHTAGGSRYPWQQAALATCTGKCKRELIINVDVSFASDIGNAQHHRVIQGKRVAIEAEHEAAMQRSRREMANA